MEPENNRIMNSMVRLQGIQTCGLFLLLLSLDSALAQRNGKRFSCSRKIVLSGVSLGSGLRSPISFAPLFSAPECWNGFFCYGIQKYYFCSTRRSTPENEKSAGRRRRMARNSCFMPGPWLWIFSLSFEFLDCNSTFLPLLAFYAGVSSSLPDLRMWCSAVRRVQAEIKRFEDNRSVGCFALKLQLRLRVKWMH